MFDSTLNCGSKCVEEDVRISRFSSTPQIRGAGMHQETAIIPQV